MAPLICGYNHLFQCWISVQYIHTRWIDWKDSKGVMRLSTRERILMIRLLEKIEQHPTYAKTLGLEATGAVNNQNMESEQKGLTDA